MIYSYSYRNLLDSWHFWAQRASFDIALSACNSSNKPSHQVYISCNYCGKSVSAYMQGLHRSRNSFARIAATSNKFKVGIDFCILNIIFTVKEYYFLIANVGLS